MHPPFTREDLVVQKQSLETRLSEIKRLLCDTLPKHEFRALVRERQDIVAQKTQLDQQIVQANAEAKEHLAALTSAPVAREQRPCLMLIQLTKHRQVYHCIHEDPNEWLVELVDSMGIDAPGVLARHFISKEQAARLPKEAWTLPE